LDRGPERERSVLHGTGDQGRRLSLTAKEAFFPSLGLTVAGEGLVTDVDNLNGGKSFATIEGWDEGDVAEWGLFARNPGEIEQARYRVGPS
jgi:hypothetical protein